MFARIVRTVFFVLVFLGTLSAQKTVTVRLESGWNPEHVARNFTGKLDNFCQFTYRDVKGKDITAEVVDQKTCSEKPKAHFLPVGTVIEIPANLVNTKEVDPQGKTLRQLCAENKLWNCLQLEVSNHIASMKQVLTSPIRVPQTKESPDFTAKDFPTPPAGYTIDYTKLLQTLFLNTFDVITLALIAAILAAVCLFRFVPPPAASSIAAAFFKKTSAWTVRRSKRARALFKSLRDVKFPAIINFRFRSPHLYIPVIFRRGRRYRLKDILNAFGDLADSAIEIPLGFLKSRMPITRPIRLLSLFPRDELTVYDGLSCRAFSDAFREFIPKIIPNPQIIRKIGRDGKIYLYVFPTGKKKYPNLFSFRKQALELDQVVLTSAFAQDFRRAAPPRHAFSLRGFKFGVRYVYERGNN